MEDYKRIQDFLNAFEGKSKEDSLELMKIYGEDADLFQEIISIIEKNHASQICDSICELLFHLHSFGKQESTIFCLQFIPALIWAYYSLHSTKIRWSSSRIETLLLFLYNEIVRANTETPFVNSFSIPSLSKASIYHDPMSLAMLVPDSFAMPQENIDKPFLLKGPSKFIDRIPAGMRSLVIKTALKEYSTFLCCYSISSLHSFCNMVIRLSCCGYPITSSVFCDIPEEDLKSLQRHRKVHLSSEIIKEMITVLHFAAFNGCSDLAVSAMKCICRKANYSVSAVATLAANSLQDIIHLSTNVSDDTFGLVPPLNPCESVYRGVASLSIAQKRRLNKVTPYTPRTLSRPPSVKPSADISNEGESSNIIEESESKTSTLNGHDDVIDSAVGVSSTVSCTSTVEHVNGDVDKPLIVIKNQMLPPKIIIELDDPDEDKNSDKTPLIRCTTDSSSNSNNSSELSCIESNNPCTPLQKDAAAITVNGTIDVSDDVHVTKF